jgi:hypothetical protein
LNAYDPADKTNIRGFSEAISTDLLLKTFKNHPLILQFMIHIHSDVDEVDFAPGRAPLADLLDLSEMLGRAEAQAKPEKEAVCLILDDIAYYVNGNFAQNHDVPRDEYNFKMAVGYTPDQVQQELFRAYAGEIAALLFSTDSTVREMGKEHLRAFLNPKKLLAYAAAGGLGGACVGYGIGHPIIGGLAGAFVAGPLIRANSRFLEYLDKRDDFLIQRSCHLANQHRKTLDNLMKTY